MIYLGFFLTTGPTLKTIVVAQDSTPLLLNDGVTVRCTWSTEFRNYPFQSKTFVTFWWRDVRNETFVDVCRLQLLPSNVEEVKCNAVNGPLKRYPKFAGVAKSDDAKDLQDIQISEIHYKSEVKCSFSLLGDLPSYSKAIDIPVLGKVIIFFTFLILKLNFSQNRKCLFFTAKNNSLATFPLFCLIS